MTAWLTDWLAWETDNRVLSLPLFGGTLMLYKLCTVSALSSADERRQWPNGQMAPCGCSCLSLCFTIPSHSHALSAHSTLAHAHSVGQSSRNKNLRRRPRVLHCPLIAPCLSYHISHSARVHSKKFLAWLPQFFFFFLFCFLSLCFGLFIVSSVCVCSVFYHRFSALHLYFCQHVENSIQAPPDTVAIPSARDAFQGY